MIELEIDGKKVCTAQGSMIIEAADGAGIYIPRFCYHKKLSIAANCRMCLVEVDKIRKPVPACATPVTAGMQVFTKSAMAIDAQRAVMEFLLINHPLDCPICDQGGECELQDLSMGYGKDVSRFFEGKRAVEDENLGALVATDMTRCIQCTRCVRFGDEVAGLRELGGMGRGEHLEIGTYVGHALQSELSGNMIDLCPVGALTSKPFRFRARAWELEQHPSVSPHDCVGSNIYVHTRKAIYSPRCEVMRVVPRDNEVVNETWIADRDRFSYEGLQSADRLLTPQIKEKGKWRSVDWPSALNFAVARLKKVSDTYGPQQIGALASPNCTTEEFYLLQKLLRSMGSQNIDHRTRQLDFSHQAHASLYPSLGTSLEDLENLQVTLLVGSDTRREQPLINHRIRKSVLRDGKVMCVNPVDFTFNFPIDIKAIVNIEEMVSVLAGIAKVLLDSSQVEIKKEHKSAAQALLKDIQPTAMESVMAGKLYAAERSAILLGTIALNHPNAAALQVLCELISELTPGGSCGYLSEGANSAGAWLAGAIPHRAPVGGVMTPGLDAKAMFDNALRAYILMGLEPELDSANSALALQALTNAECVIAIHAFSNAAMLEYADVILPMAAFTETQGTYVNVEGRWQSFLSATLPPLEARPAWKILRVLGNLLELPGFDYQSASEVLEELKSQMVKKTADTCFEWFCPSHLPKPSKALTRVGTWPIYRVDGLVRRAPALQASVADGLVAVARVSPAVAKQLQLAAGEDVRVRQGDCSIILKLVVDEKVSDGSVVIYSGLKETMGLGDALGPIFLEPLQ